MANTVILNFHPTPSTSKANAALAEAAASLPGVEVIQMADQIDAEGQFDVDAEIERLLSADQLVFQFPMMWYAPPALLANWQTQVITKLLYTMPEAVAQLEGRRFLVAATGGGTPEAYSAEGSNGFPLADLLLPLAATAHRSGLVWQEPHLVYAANALEPEELAREAIRYRERIAAYTSQPADAETVSA